MLFFSTPGLGFRLWGCNGSRVFVFLATREEETTEKGNGCSFPDPGQARTDGFKSTYWEVHVV